jgi:hypothetical protein
MNKDYKLAASPDSLRFVEETCLHMAETYTKYPEEMTPGTEWIYSKIVGTWKHVSTDPRWKRDNAFTQIYARRLREWILAEVAQNVNDKLRRNGF